MVELLHLKPRHNVPLSTWLGRKPTEPDKVFLPQVITYKAAHDLELKLPKEALNSLHSYSLG